MADGAGNRLEDALAHLGADRTALPNLRASFALSETRIKTARETLGVAEFDEPFPFDVVAFGSMARYEMTHESDFDYLVIAHGLYEEPLIVGELLESADQLRSVLASEGAQAAVRAPGSSGLFGTMVSAPDLVEFIGLERDTNHSLTRRILLLEESVSLLRPSRHELLVKAIIRRYLEAGQPSASGVPRFLLNDLIRYWRTQSVDFQAKTRPPARYSVRYFKLLICRKYTFASSILPLLLIDSSQVDLATRLYEIFAVPPVLRMLDAASTLREAGDQRAADAIVEATRALDAFNGLLGHKSWRSDFDRLCGSEVADIRESDAFMEVKAEVDRMQGSLESALFGNHTGELAKKYLVL